MSQKKMKSQPSKIKWDKPRRRVPQGVRPDKNLLEHQRRVVMYMLNHRGALVYHGMGSGKTRIAVILVALLKIPTIVVLPASLRENFRKEIRNTKVSESLFTILSSQTFLEQPVDCTDKLLIIDESHMLRNAEGKISKKVVDCAERSKKVLLLTGTPLVNRPHDIAPLLNMIVKNKIRISVGTIWNKQTFTEIPTGDAFDRTFGTDGLNEVGKKLWSELFPCMFSYYSRPAVSSDFPTIRFIDVKLPLSPTQSEVYKAWESRTLTPSMVKMLANPKTALDVTKMPQFRAYLDGGRRICNVAENTNTGQIMSPKFTSMIQTVKQSAGKAVVFSHYLDKGISIAEHMFNANKISFAKFTGKQTSLQKKEAVETYNNDKVQVFLLSSAGGVGLDLHETETVHIMDPAWNEADILQAIYRAVRFKSHSQPNAVVTVHRYYCYKPYTSPTPSADMYLMQVSKNKEKINQEFLSYAIQHSMENQGVGSCTIETL